MKMPRKLQPYQVVLLRQMRREGFTRPFLSRLFGLSLNSLHQILARSTYKDVR
jgi:lambda repressor-like predicted transcriptional regulator